MKKVFLLLISFFIFQVSFSQEKWNEQNNCYVNYDYNFAWDLGSDLDWNRVMEVSKKTVFKAKCNEAPIIVFVMPNEYNAKLENVDIWEMFQKFKNLEDISNKKFLEIGINQRTLSIKKVSFSGKHAVKVVSRMEGVDKDDISIEKDTKISIRTIHNGRLYSICITLLTDLYEELLKQGLNIESLFKGFAFFNDKRLETNKNSSVIESKRSNYNVNETVESDSSVLSKKLIKSCKQLNEQTPIKVDDLTTLYSAAYFNKSLNFFYKVDVFVNDFTKDDLERIKIAMEQFQKQMVYDMLSMSNTDSSPGKMYDMMKKYDLKVHFYYRDINDKLILETQLTCEDFN